MITKKIGKKVFGWDPTAMNGKGYWYLWSPGDVLSRAASSEEAQKLGKPKTKDMPKSGSDKKKYYYDVGTHGKPVRKQIYTGSEYEEADITNRKGLMQLASERMMSGEGLGKSLSSAVTEKFKAKATKLKKLKDPLNWLSKMPGVGKLAATAYGKKFGRSNEDISYFTGVHAPPGMEQEESETAQPMTATKSETSGKTLSKIYSLLLKKFQMEDTSAFDEEQKAEDDKKHKELIEALTKNKEVPKEKQKEEEDKGLFGGILSTLSSIFSGFIGKLSSLFTIFGNIGRFAFKAGAGVISAGAAAVRGVTGFAGRAASSVKKGIGSLVTKGKELVKPTVKTGLDTNKSALLQAKPTTVSKVTEAAEKSGSALAKTASTATKVAKGAGSKLLKGGSKLLGFLKSVPGISTVAAGADLIMRINEVNDKLENGQITDAEYKKEMTKAVGDAAAAGLLPVLGATLGSVIPGVGTLAGGLAGAGVALLGGDKVGGWLAEKVYDHFIEGKDTSEQLQTASVIPPSATATTTPTQTPAVPVQSPTPSPIATRAQAATNENLNLTGPTSTMKTQPIIINSPTTNVMGGGKSSGSSISASVRNDDPILTRLQFQNVRPV